MLEKLDRTIEVLDPNNRRVAHTFEDRTFLWERNLAVNATVRFTPEFPCPPRLLPG